MSLSEKEGQGKQRPTDKQFVTQQFTVGYISILLTKHLTLSMIHILEILLDCDINVFAHCFELS